nr:integrase, catalytic region, zinc finger, CCHC-type, peptidase aspartic, catalytic [Tanacetum cinerariifolium]
MQLDKQGLLNPKTVKVKDIWLRNALSLCEQGLQPDPRVLDCQVVQTIIPNNATFQTKDLDTYDSDCDDISNEKVILMAIISSYGSDIILEKAQRIKPTLYDGIIISAKHVAMHVIDDEETLILEEESRSKMSAKDKDLETIKRKICNKPIDYVKFNKLYEDFRKRFVPQKELSADEALWYHMLNPSTKSSDALLVKIEAPKELSKVSLVIESLKNLKLHLANFVKVVKIRTTPNARTEDVLLTVMNSMSLIDESVNVERKRNESRDTCFNLKAELLKSQNSHNDLLKRCSELEKHFIFLESSIQLNQEIFQKDESCDNQNALEIPEYFQNNNLKAQLHDKDSTICKLKDIIKSMREKSKDKNVNFDYVEIETKKVELEKSVAKLISENERLCNEINHVKQVLKEQFDSVKKIRVSTKEQSDSLIDKLNLKYAKNKDLKAQIQDKGIVEQARAKQPLDNVLDFSCKHAQRIQELLVYVTDTCPNAINLSAKKVAITPKNNVKKVRFAKPLTSSSNIKQVVHIVLWYLDTRCLKHMTGNRSQVMNFVSKFLGIVNFGNDHIARIMGYGDYEQGNVTISKVYYVEGLGHNLFFVGQFCDVDLEVAFWKNTCFICNLEGVNLIFRSRDTNLYTISLDDMLKTSLICLLSKASRTKRWLWHCRLSHLNFGTLNKLAKDGLARDILRLKFQKDLLYLACRLGKSKKSSHQSKAKNSNQEKLYLLHMDLCGLMPVASINEKSSGPIHQCMTPTTSSSGLVPNPILQQPCIPPNIDDKDHLFQPMFDEYFNPPTIAVSPVPVAAAPRVVDLANSPMSTSIDKYAPSASIPSTQEQEHSPNISQEPKNFKQVMTKPSWIDAMQEENHEFKRLQATVSVHKSAIKFMINKKKVSLDVDMFREIVKIFPKIARQEFEDLVLEHDILSFISNLGYTRDITYLTDVNVDYLHQPWRAFATIINNKKDFHISHASGLGDGVDTQSKVPDELQQKTFEADINDNDSDENDDKRIESDSDVIPDPCKTNEEHDEEEEEYDDEFNLKEDENINEEEDDDKDVNVNLGNKDVDMTYTDQGAIEQQNDSHLSGFEQEEEDTHVTLTPVLDVQKTRGPIESSSISSDFTSKFLNLHNLYPADNEIASLMDTTTYHATSILEIASSFATLTPLPTLFFNPISQQATPTPTPTASETITILPAILDFTSVFKFNERVTNLEKDLSKIKKVDQTIIKEEVNAQLPQILPQAISDVATPVIKKNVIESLETDVLTRSLSQPQSSYEAAATLSEFELTKILMAKMDKNKSFDVADYKRELYDALTKSYKMTNISSSHMEFITGDNKEQPADKEVTKADWFKKPKRPPTLDPD